jgi:hypothetical protein
LISQWCMMCPIKSIKFLYFLSFKLNIKCYNLTLLFYLDVFLWFLNFIKFYFSPTTHFKNKLFHYKGNIF